MMPQPLALVLASPIINTCDREVHQCFVWPVSGNFQSDFQGAKALGRQVVCVILEQGHFIDTACTVVDIKNRVARMIVLHRARHAMVVAESLDAVLTSTRANDIFGWLQEHSEQCLPPPPPFIRQGSPWLGLESHSGVLR